MHVLTPYPYYHMNTTKQICFNNFKWKHIQIGLERINHWTKHWLQIEPYKAYLKILKMSMEKLLGSIGDVMFLSTQDAADVYGSLIQWSWHVSDRPLTNPSLSAVVWRGLSNSAAQMTDWAAWSWNNATESQWLSGNRWKRIADVMWRW